MTYRIEYYHVGGECVTSARYTYPVLSMSSIVQQAHDMLSMDSVIVFTPYRVVDIESSEVVTEFTHDNMWLLERLI